MNLSVRGQLDRLFTAATGLSVVLLILALVAVLGPMVRRGSSAVFFQGTVEFRKMQRNLFGAATSRYSTLRSPRPSRCAGRCMT